MIQVFQKSLIFPDSSCTLKYRKEATEQIKCMGAAVGMVLPGSEAGRVA